eukprot:TRINITY_DN19429_c4_g1_i2.p1 TRINITY_DN19429_c4_g1~~TRINITY_DN19429_c4_g1_i2.p1  ORF type:complete len:177 (+),score=48.68 TRINITY_DN19429_c4_g1_i2:25-531(+)
MSALSRDDFSSVWKDGGNVIKETGLTLNLVEHLEKQRKIGSWVLQKEKLLQLLNFGAYGHPVTALDIGSGLGVDVIAMAKELAQRNPHGGKVIGVDFNTEMTNHANALLEKEIGWVKLRGLGEMIVKKGAITREVADEYIQRYIKAAEAKQIITVGTIFLTQAQKPNQ